jgi:hypothetical protein
MFLTQSFGQTFGACSPALDTLSVLKIAKSENKYPGKDLISYTLIFNSEKCHWILTRKKTTYPGRFSKFKGSSKVVSRIWIIDDQQKKVIDKKKEVNVYPNC